MSNDTKKSLQNKIIVGIFVLTFLSAVFSNFYHFFYTKNYDYLVEASCDPTIENCFVRDCENPDDCPPNGLAVYKEYYVKAYDFANCSDNSCAEQCSSGVVKCEVVECGEEDECSANSELEQ